MKNKEKQGKITKTFEINDNHRKNNEQLKMKDGSL